MNLKVAQFTFRLCIIYHKKWKENTNLEFIDKVSVVGSIRTVSYSSVDTVSATLPE